MADKISAKIGGGRPATGSIVWEDPETRTRPRGVRVTRADGSRRIIRFDIGTTPEDALALAPVIAERARFAVDASTGERPSRSTRSVGVRGAKHAGFRLRSSTVRGSPATCSRY
jgi:hypothetical protein